MKFHIANMTCGGCAKGVTATLKKVDPAVQPQIDLDRKEVAIEGSAVQQDQFIKALTAAGWESEPLAA